MTDANWMGPYFPGKWGVVRYTPKQWPEWVSAPRWSQDTANHLAERYTAQESQATILRHRGARYFPVESGRAYGILAQFERILREVSA